jgi:hypothetical protein
VGGGCVCWKKNKKNKRFFLCVQSIEMGATASAPFKAMSMTNGNINRSFGVPSSGLPATNTTAVASTNVSAPSTRRNRRNNQTGMMGGKRNSRRSTRKSRMGLYRKRR